MNKTQEELLVEIGKSLNTARVHLDRANALFNRLCEQLSTADVTIGSTKPVEIQVTLKPYEDEVPVETDEEKLRNRVRDVR